MFDKLKPEIWLHILGFLSTGLPKPLSGWTKSEAVGEDQEVIDGRPEDGASGTTTRMDIRSPDLAVLMRTSINFNHLASRILYRRVITDDIRFLLFYHNNPPAHPLVASKHSLLRKIRFIHLEYKAKNLSPTYTTLMSDGRYWKALPDPCDPIIPALIMAQIEAIDLQIELKLFADILGKAPSSNIIHATIGAIFSGQDGLWQFLAPPPNETNANDWGTMQILIAQCRVATEVAFRLLSLRHFCQRGTAGPLSLPPLITWYEVAEHRHPPTLPVFTMHFGRRTTPIPAVIGLPTRWSFEDHGHRNDIHQIHRAVADGITLAKFARGQTSGFLRSIAHEFPKTCFELDIWASGNQLAVPKASAKLDAATRAARTGFRMDAQTERRTTEEYARRVVAEADKGLSLGRGVRRDHGDVINLQSSLDAPRCEACCWEV